MCLPSGHDYPFHFLALALLASEQQQCPHSYMGAGRWRPLFLHIPPILPRPHVAASRCDAKSLCSRLQGKVSSVLIACEHLSLCGKEKAHFMYWLP